MLLIRWTKLLFFTGFFLPSGSQGVPVYPQKLEEAQGEQIPGELSLTANTHYHILLLFQQALSFIIKALLKWVELRPLLRGLVTCFCV